jgi:transcriptional regulator with XRE-family HTH domain
MEFGEWLADELQRRQLTQIAFAVRIQCTQGALNHIMNGNRNA